MADNDNYIGIAMGLDVTSLKAGLSEANKQIQLANSEFKAASSGMDDWSKSVEGVSAKVKQLDTVLSAQKSKLAGLKAEYEKVAKTQGENSEAARKLKVQINNQQSVVNTTQREFDNYSETLKEAKSGNIDLTETVIKNGKALKDQGEAAKESGSKLEGLKSVGAGVAGGIAAIGAAAVGAVGSFLSLAESTREYRQDLNKLTAAYEQAGFSAEETYNAFNYFGSVLGDTKKADETMQQLAQLVTTEQDLVDWTDTLTGVYATFGNAIPTETLTEAINHTVQMGEVQGTLADALEWGGISADDFNEQLAQCGSEAEKTALIQSTLNGMYKEAGDRYNELNKDILDYNTAQTNLQHQMAQIGAVAEPIMTMLTQMAADLLKEVSPFVELIGEGLKGALEGSSGAADTLAQGLSGILTTLAEKLIAALPTIASVGIQLIQTLAMTLLENLPQILQVAIQIILTLVQGISQMLPSLIPAIVDAVLLIVETLIDNLDLIIDAGIELILALADGLIEALPRLIEKIPVIIEKLMNAFARNYPKLIEAGVQLLVKLAAGLIKAIPQLVSKIPEIISAIVSGFGEYASNMKDVGLNLVKGIWEGITGAADWLKNKITGFASDVAGWFKDTFQIKSPSRLMADEVGEYIGEGIGVGVVDSIPAVKKQLGKFASFVQDNLGGIKSGLSIDASGAVAGGGRVGGNTVINAGMTVNYNGSLSRKQIKQIENDNYNSIRMRLRAEGAI